MNYRNTVTNFANLKAHTNFNWGYNDCNTLALEYIKFALPNTFNILDKVIGKYETKKQAFAFYNKFKWTWESYLEEAGFREVNINFFQPGDLHIHTMGKSAKSVSINLGEKNLVADQKLGIGLTDFFELKDAHLLKGYRHKE